MSASAIKNEPQGGEEEREPPMVMELKLARQNLDRLPQEMLTYKYLHFLDLSHNRLAELPSEFVDLKLL